MDPRGIPSLFRGTKLTDDQTRENLHGEYIDLDIDSPDIETPTYQTQDWRENPRREPRYHVLHVGYRFGPRPSWVPTPVRLCHLPESRVSVSTSLDGVPENPNSTWVPLHQHPGIRPSPTRPACT